MSSDGFRPRNEAPGISASVRIESHAAIAVAMLDMHKAQGLSGLALVLVVTISPEQSAIMKVVYTKAHDDFKQCEAMYNSSYKIKDKFKTNT